MADVYVCGFCDREVTKGQGAIESITCCSWVHKGCTGLGKAEYDGVVSDFRKYKSYKWECKSCKKSEVKRLSVGVSSGSVSDGRETTLSCSAPGSGKRKGRVGRSAAQLSCPVIEAVVTGQTEATVKSQVSSLLNKTNTSNKDILLVVSHIVNLLLDQRNDLQAALDNIKEKQRLGNEKIELLECEVAQLKGDIVQLREENSLNLRDGNRGKGDGSTNNLDMFQEIQERNVRSKNIMVFNVAESPSKVVEERVNHDKAQILDILSRLEVDPPNEFRVQRIGRVASSPRPIRAVFNSPLLSMACLRKKFKLKPSNINIKSDLTPMQRLQIKKLYEELEARKQKGEDGLMIRYRNGNPFITKGTERKDKTMN